MSRYYRTSKNRAEIVRIIKLQFAVNQIRGEKFDFYQDPAIKMISTIILKNYETDGTRCINVSIPSKLDPAIKTIPQDIVYIVNLHNDIRKEDGVKVSLGAVKKMRE